MSRLNSLPDRFIAGSRPRLGMSLIEILVVLAIFALATALVTPSLSRMMDQTTSHAVFFEFQRDVADLRREVSRTGQPMRIVDPEVADRLVDDHQITLREPWRYTIAPAMEISEGGVCSPATANLISGDSIVMTLVVDGASCRFSRVQPGAGRPRAPSSP